MRGIAVHLRASALISSGASSLAVHLRRLHGDHRVTIYCGLCFRGAYDSLVKTNSIAMVSQTYNDLSLSDIVLKKVR